MKNIIKSILFIIGLAAAYNLTQFLIAAITYWWRSRT